MSYRDDLSTDLASASGMARLLDDVDVDPPTEFEIGADQTDARLPMPVGFEDFLS